eukprot:3004804-Pyramimonas_sp.AAC.1
MIADSPFSPARSFWMMTWNAHAPFAPAQYGGDIARQRCRKLWRLCDIYITLRAYRGVMGTRRMWRASDSSCAGVTSALRRARQLPRTCESRLP